MENLITEDINEVSTFVKHFEDFIDVTEEARQQSEKCRDYFDGKQYTADEARKLAERGQPATVNNRIKPKVEYMKGLNRQTQVDPVALPRNRETDEGGADAISKALRYIADNNEFDDVDLEVYEEFLVEGYSGVIIEGKRKKNSEEVEVWPQHIPWDRIYFDPHSRKKFFQDAKYKGLVSWMYADDAIDKFGEGKREVIEAGFDDGDATTFNDRPNFWIDRKQKRVRVCQHYFRYRGVWYEAYFTKLGFLLEPRPSPYLDEEGDPICPIELFRAYVDRDNNTYSMTKDMIDLQDEVNKRRSKALHLINNRQTIGEKGAIDDVDKMKREMSKPDGHIEVNPEMRFEMNNTGDMAQGHLLMLQDAKNELDSRGVNAALAGTEERDLSGKALDRLRSGGLTEIADIISIHRRFRQRVYRQIWYRVKQFWNEEKWLRVTENKDDLKWVVLNQKKTVAEILQERIQDENAPEQVRMQSAQILQAMIQTNDARLGFEVITQNEVSKLDLDVILSESPDAVNIQQEQFEILAKLAQMYGPEAVPFEALLRLSQIKSKDEVLELLQGDESEAKELAQLQLQQQQEENEIRKAGEIAKVEKTQQESRVKQAEATQKQLENELLIRQPFTKVTNVSL